MCEEFDMTCRIHRLEDKLLRSKNPYEQMELHSVIMKYRTRLQKLQWSKQKKKSN